MNSLPMRRAAMAVALFAVVTSCADDPVGPFGPVPAGVSGRIAYSTGREVYVWTVRSGALNRIYLTDSPDSAITTLSWSPNGSLVMGLEYLDTLPETVLVVRDAWMILVGADGVNPQLLYDATQREVGPSVAADGRLTYCAVTSRSARLMIDGDSTTIGCAPDLRYAWAPDGGWIYYSGWGIVERVNVTTAQVQRVFDWPLVDSVYFIPRAVAVGPTGRLAFGAWEELANANVFRSGVWVSDSVGGALAWVAGERVPDNTYGNDSLLHGHPTWSPDGALIAYIRLNAIWVVPASGGTPQRLAAIPGVRALAWRH